MGQGEVGALYERVWELEGKLEEVTADFRKLQAAVCRSVHGGWKCNVLTDPRAPHVWHAAVVEGIVTERWRDS